jgi:hypothetical protein
LYSISFSPFIIGVDLVPSVAQGIPSVDSDNEWDNAIIQRYGRRHQEALDTVDMDVDVNVVEAVQHAFHVYD